jgi:transcriptional regulator with XRE-family HTH domain
MGNLKDLREAKGLSIEQVCVALGKSYSAVRFWESGRNTPNLTPMETKKLLDIYGVSLEDLIMACKNCKG